MEAKFRPLERIKNDGITRDEFFPKNCRLTRKGMKKFWKGGK
jgi:hypothetical protein